MLCVAAAFVGASLMAGCATVYVMEEDEEAIAPEVAPDPCAGLMGDACCGAGCVWLSATETMPAFCFSPDRDVTNMGVNRGRRVTATTSLSARGTARGMIRTWTTHPSACVSTRVLLS